MSDQGQGRKTRFTFEPLGPQHDRAAFSCGVEALDSYLRRQASQDVRKHAAAVFIMTPNGKTVAGFYSLSQYSVDLDVVPPEIARKLPKYPEIPATLLGRLAVSTAFRGQGAGELLLMDALSRCYSGNKQLASVAVIVDAKDDSAARFYTRYGFIALPKIERRLFMPMGTIASLFPEK